MKKDSDVYTFDLFQKLKNLIVSPNKFFNSVEKEKDYWPILRNFVVLYLISFVVSALVSLYLVPNEVTAIGLLSGLIVVIIYAFAYPFTISGVFHVGTKVFKSKANYFQSFKPVTYALMIGLVYSIISTLLLVVFPIDNSTLQTIQGSNNIDLIKATLKEYFMQPGFIITILIGLISLVHVFVLSIMGISKFHKISKPKAGFAIVLSTVVLMAILMAIFTVFYLASVQP